MKKAVRSILASLTVICLPVMASETVNVAIDPTFPPMEFLVAGERAGFDIDFAEELQKRTDLSFEYTDMDFKAMVPSVVSGRQDMILSAIYITDERAKVVDFTNSYFAAGLVILVRSDEERIKSAADLDGKRVAVQVGNKAVNLLKTDYPAVNRLEMEKNNQLFDALESGRADAVVIGRPAAMLFAKTTGIGKVLPEPLTDENYGIAVSKRKPELREALNTAIADMKADGTMTKLVDKWFGTQE